MLEHYEDVLDEAHARASDWLRGLATRHVGAQATRAELSAQLAAPVPETPTDARHVIAELAAALEPGLTASAGPRYFGFVIGGGLPAAVGADWLATAWDQNTFSTISAPAMSVLEETVRTWLLDLLDLPSEAGMGLVTGGQAGNTTCLSAARHHVLDRVGWDVEADGLQGAPTLQVVVGDKRHRTIDRSLRHLGLGAPTHVVPADDEGRMRAEALADVLAGVHGPAIVCLQSGEVNTGAFDPFEDILAVVRSATPDAWVHVDGAIGLWARASSRRHLTEGIEGADSWSTDAHKWLNVPYDTGIAFTRHPTSHASALGMSHGASYLVIDEDARADAINWVPEASRRARALPVYAALRSLGRQGLADLVERCCDLATRAGEALADADGVEVLNDVVLNQVLIGFTDGGDERTSRIIRAVQEDGTCWLGGSTWEGRPVMRLSVSNWATTPDDIDASVAAILRCAAETD